MASKRKGSGALYVALLVALIIFVPALREAVANAIAPLLDALKNLRIGS